MTVSMTPSPDECATALKVMGSLLSHSGGGLTIEHQDERKIT